MYLAKTYNPIAGFEGILSEWNIEFGDEAWVDPDEVYCEGNRIYDTNCFDNPDSDGTCVMLYSECDYKGDVFEACNDTPFTNIDWEVKSIWK